MLRNSVLFPPSQKSPLTSSSHRDSKTTPNTYQNLSLATKVNTENFQDLFRNKKSIHSHNHVFNEPGSHNEIPDSELKYNSLVSSVKDLHHEFVYNFLNEVIGFIIATIIQLIRIFEINFRKSMKRPKKILMMSFNLLNIFFKWLPEH